MTDQYIALLDHDHRLVRLNACWMLGHVRADPAASRLDDVRINDDDERVRSRAAWTLTEIDQLY
nr:HEAT repeat domain-containing protein [Halobacterium sp. TGN-42-S1]